MTSIVTSIITALALVLVAVINGVTANRQKKFELHLMNDKKQTQKQIEERERREQEREKNQQENTKLLVRLISVNTDLSVATAKAVQNIPDARADGEITAAVADALSVKRELNDFLRSQGIKNLYEKN
jgi:cell shape-determining protein MreC